MQGRNASTVNAIDLSSSTKKTKKKGKDKEEESEINFEDQIKKDESSAFDISRARRLASPDVSYFVVGSLGALMAGVALPAWGLMFAGKYCCSSLND